MEKRYFFKSLFEDKKLSVRRLNGDKQNAEEYTEMHVPLGAHFPVFAGNVVLRRKTHSTFCMSVRL
jgi:hypothetical protein